MSTRERRLAVLRAALEDVRAECPIHPPADDVVRVAQYLSPHLYDGSFAKLLASAPLFTPAQALDSVVAKREEHELEVEQVLLYFLNPPTEGAT